MANWVDVERDVIAEFLQRQYQGLMHHNQHNWTEDAEMLQKAIGATLLTRGADVSAKPVPVSRTKNRVRFL
jgi:hypothetical protein